MIGQVGWDMIRLRFVILPSLLAMSSLPKYQEIYRRFRLAIDQGQLGPGDRVPSVRSLALELKVARGTVEAAYQLLVSEGFLRRGGRRVPSFPGHCRRWR